MSLVEALVKKGLLQEQDLNSLAEVQSAAPNRPVHELLIERGFAREEDILSTLADECGLDLVDLAKVTLEPETLKAMPLKMVHRRNLIPLSRNNGTLVVATGNPYEGAVVPRQRDQVAAEQRHPRRRGTTAPSSSPPATPTTFTRSTN